MCRKRGFMEINEIRFDDYLYEGKFEKIQFCKDLKNISQHVQKF